MPDTIDTADCEVRRLRAALAQVQTDADAYRRLADAIEATMPDPDAWDGDEAEEALLARYVEYLATASHGICARCEIRLYAGERYEVLPDLGRVHSACVDAAEVAVDA